MKTAAASIDLNISWCFVILLLIGCAIFLMPDVLYAYTPRDSTEGDYICWIADNFTGNAGRGIATIGISVIGVLALIGRITWTQAIIIGVGCAVLFGAAGIVYNLGGNTLGSAAAEGADGSSC